MMGLSNLKGRKMTVNSRCSNGTMVVALDEGIGSAELSDLGSMITIKGLDKLDGKGNLEINQRTSPR